MATLSFPGSSDLPKREPSPRPIGQDNNDNDNNDNDNNEKDKKQDENNNNNSSKNTIVNCDLKTVLSAKLPIEQRLKGAENWAAWNASFSTLLHLFGLYKYFTSTTNYSQINNY